jgi:hypothetical protein
MAISIWGKTKTQTFQHAIDLFFFCNGLNLLVGLQNPNRNRDRNRTLNFGLELEPVPLGQATATNKSETEKAKKKCLSLEKCFDRRPGCIPLARPKELRGPIINKKSSTINAAFFRLHG